MSTPTADPTTADTSPATSGIDLADGQSSISCPCGFRVIGFDEDNNQAAFDSHPCPNRPAEDEPRWYHYVFGFWGWAIIATIAYAVVTVILRHTV